MTFLKRTITMFTSTTNIHCKNCHSNDLVDDHSSGDSVCRDCGLVGEKITHIDYETQKNLNEPYNPHEEYIKTFCERNHFGPSTLSSVLEYTRLYGFNRQEVHLIICSVHLIETNTNMHAFAKKHRLDPMILSENMNTIKSQFRIQQSHPDEHTYTIDQKEWIRSLYDEIIEHVNMIGNVPKRKIITIRKEIESFVKHKPEALFYNSSVLATVMLKKHKLPIDHKLPSSKIRKILKELFV